MKNIHIWGPPLAVHYVRNYFQRNMRCAGPKHILFCITDHFEPGWQSVAHRIMRERINLWTDFYPAFADKHRDSSGRPAQHTWFYAAEQYHAAGVQSLKTLCDRGFGEIELHLHHANDSADGFLEKLENAKAAFSSHGVFITGHNPPQYAFGFIHGNWALNNSRKINVCGVDSELRILRDAGCYADFTLPSAPHESQTSKINSIYYAADIPGIRKSHNQGIDVTAGGKKTGDLMLIQGPLALNWKKRKYHVLPRIENAMIHANYPADPDRIDLWIRQNIHVKQRPEWVFIKVHCHGAQERDMEVLLGKSADKMYRYLESRYNDGKKYILHYVTAREMYNIIKAAEDGHTGNPCRYRDYKIGPYLKQEKRAWQL